MTARVPTGPGWWWVSIDGRDPVVAYVSRSALSGGLVVRYAGCAYSFEDATPIAPVAPIGSVPPEVYARDVLGPFAHTQQDVARTLTAHGLTPDEAARVVAWVAS